MLPLAFIGGAIVGAAGLTAAALWDKNKIESQFPAQLKATSSLSEEQVCRLLNDYYLKSNALAIKVSNYVMESSGPAYFATLEMPDESMFEKVFRAVADKISPTMRKWRIDGMMALKSEAEKLYGRYRGVFNRANNLLRERGRQSLDLRSLTFKGVDFSMNNSIDNEDWGLELNDLSDKIRKYLDDSADIADRFVQIFEGREPVLALQGKQIRPDAIWARCPFIWMRLSPYPTGYGGMEQKMLKMNEDASPGEKLLRLFQKLMLDGRKHFQQDLAEYLECSPQSVMRLVADIESVVGASLDTGLEKHRRWYQIKSISRNRLGLEFEELRYLSICRDLAEPYLSKEVKERVDQSIFNFSMLMADEEYAEREKAQQKQFAHCPKGWIDYTPYFGYLEKLVESKDMGVVCLVRYKALASQRIREHRFALSRIVSMNSALYALGAGVTEDFRQMRHLTNLAVHRIKDVVLTDQKVNFKIPEEDSASFGLPWHEPKDFRIHFNAGKPADYVRERVWSDKQKMTWQADGSLVLEMTSRSQPEVEAWVRSFGEEAELMDIEDETRNE